MRRMLMRAGLEHCRLRELAASATSLKPLNKTVLHGSGLLSSASVPKATATAAAAAASPARNQQLRNRSIERASSYQVHPEGSYTERLQQPDVAPEEDWQRLPLPLHERPAAHACQLTDLRAWHACARSAAAATADTFTADDGPTSQELQRELDWVLDDAVACVRKGPADSWQDTSWRMLQPELKSSGREQTTATWELSLRTGLAELEALWDARLEQRVPLQYLTNCAHWWRFELAVGPGVLIPRPETEQLLELAAAALAARPQLAKGPWADLGTGSGAIALGLTTLLNPGAQVHAVDASPQAAAWARLNVHRVPHAASVQVSLGSWFQPLQHLEGQLAGIVSNPPYIPRHDMAGLQAEVGRHEPHTALDGGADSGCDALDAICTGAVPMLQRGGFLALETNGGAQAHGVAAMLEDMLDPSLGTAAWEDAHVLADCFGVDRFVTANRT